MHCREICPANFPSQLQQITGQLSASSLSFLPVDGLEVQRAEAMFLGPNRWEVLLSQVKVNTWDLHKSAQRPSFLLTGVAQKAFLMDPTQAAATPSVPMTEEADL